MGNRGLEETSGNLKRLKDSQETENVRGRDCLPQAPNECVQIFHSTARNSGSSATALRPGLGRFEGLRDACVTTQYLHTVVDRRLDGILERDGRKVGQEGAVSFGETSEGFPDALEEGESSGEAQLDGVLVPPSPRTRGGSEGKCVTEGQAQPPQDGILEVSVHGPRSFHSPCWPAG